MINSSFVSKRCTLSRQPPLPIFDFDESGNSKYVSTQPMYQGKFTGFNVTVQAQHDVINLYTKGYFGKGNLSHGYPSYHKRLLRNLTACESVDVTSPCESNQTLKDEIVVKKSDETIGECLYPHGSHELSSKTVIPRGNSVSEELHLSLEEAFFLSYGLKCLQIYNGDMPLDHHSAWLIFREVQPNFIERYVAYHHFRSKGWVVRSAVKFGGDYVLYKDGPPFYHATYVVFIISNNPDVNFFLACHRTVEVTKKELLICRVKAPDSQEKYVDLDRLEEFEVSEYTLKRWVPSENRNTMSK